MASSSVIRQNYHEETEAGVNKMINMELEGSYVYMAMVMHFDRHDMAFDGAREYFKELTDLKRDHAVKLMYYQNQRGGRIVTRDIKAPTTSEWASHKAALEDTLVCEKETNRCLLELHAIGEKHHDAHIADFLEREFLREIVKSIKEVAEQITNATRVGCGLGEYQFDLHSMKE